MTGEHVVGRGECLGSIAAANGLFWQTVWDRPENSELRRRRENPNVLRAGDVVFVPDRREKTESGATETRHRFRRRGVPSSLHLVLRHRNGDPIAGEAYTLTVDGRIFEGTTDGEGAIRQSVPPGAGSGTLRVPELGLSVTLRLGDLDPFDTVSGAKQRLSNLGYGCGPGPDLDEATQQALRAFQADRGATQTGQLDDATRTQLRDAHGS